MELIELFSPPSSHSTPDPECPFCPKGTPDEFTSYPGKANNSGKLAKIMAKPSLLTSEQGGTRPKEGKANQQPPSRVKRQPQPIFSHARHGAYSCEAHHAISGNQAMKGRPIENWIVAGPMIEKDTGYSINNADNGVWLPSIPEKYKGGRWGALSPKQKKAIAFTVMRAPRKGQFHKGPHDIVDPEDPYGTYHKSYKSELVRLLKELSDNIHGWSEHCYTCEDIDPEKGPWDPNWKVNEKLDRLSGAIADHLKASPSRWEYFISRIAMDFHKTKCRHRKTREM